MDQIPWLCFQIQINTYRVLKIPHSCHQKFLGLEGCLYWMITIPNTLGTIMHFSHQPTGVLNIAHINLVIYGKSSSLVEKTHYFYDHFQVHYFDITGGYILSIIQMVYVTVIRSSGHLPLDSSCQAPVRT